MNYEDMTYEFILNRMLDKIPDGMDKKEGSIIYDALAPAAAELAIMYIEFQTILNESYADTASRDYLIKRAAERGIVPHEATNAVLEAHFTPTELDIPIGARFNCDDLNYTVISKISNGKYQLKCETLGIEGNKILDTLIPIDYIEGLETSELTNILIPGEDEEDTERLRERYFSSFENNAFSGNIADYIEKTNSIDGVGSTKVTPIWNGGGTVLLTILDSNFNKASDALLSIVKNEIDPDPSGDGLGLAPIGHHVTINTVQEVGITISANIEFETGIAFNSLKSSIEGVLKDYLLELRKTWANNEGLLVRISQVENRILNIDGIVDISNTTINDAQANFSLSKYEIPVLESVSVS